jgi:hypothetical protein
MISNKVRCHHENHFPCTICARPELHIDEMAGRCSTWQSVENLGPQELKLPSIHEWFSKHDNKEPQLTIPDTLLARHSLQPTPIKYEESSSVSTPPSLICSTSTAVLSTSCSTIRDVQYMADEDCDASFESVYRRAEGAKDIVRRSFGHLNSNELFQIRNNINPSCSRFRSEIETTVAPALRLEESSSKDSRAMKHGKMERNRRKVHSFMLSELGKRFSIPVLKLTGYQPENGKPPGKNHLYVAGLIQIEFDSLFEEKLRIEKEREYARAEKAEKQLYHISQLVRSRH